MLEDHDGHRLFVGGCLEYLETIEDNSIDAVITDPPFGMRGNPAPVGGRKANPLKLSWDTSMPLDYMGGMARVMKPGAAALVFVDSREPGTMWDAMIEAGLGPRALFYWIKPNPVPNPRKSFMSGVEIAVFARKSGKVLCWNGGGVTPNYWHGPSARGVLPPSYQGRLTPTPLGLIKHLINIVTEPGHVVLDLFLGSGTTLVACNESGRRGWGSEVDVDHAAIARSRILASTAQWRLL